MLQDMDRLLEKLTGIDVVSVILCVRVCPPTYFMHPEAARDFLFSVYACVHLCVCM